MGYAQKFIDALPAADLKKEISWWGEEQGGKVTSAYQLEEDYVQTDYGCEPASVQEYEVGDDPYPVAYKKGYPIIGFD